MLTEFRAVARCLPRTGLAHNILVATAGVQFVQKLRITEDEGRLESYRSWIAVRRFSSTRALR